MPDIVLATINAKYLHAAFGLRYLRANLGDLEDRSCILEFDLSQRATDIVETLLREKPVIIGLGVYIWNASLSTEVVSILKRVAPGLKVVLGGPEVSFEWETQPIVDLADFLVTGEADLAFEGLCRQILDGAAPLAKIIHSPLPELQRLRLPYYLYDDQDIRHRVIYVEASRGCPFTCEFCLSSLEVPVRQFDLDALLADFERLLARGVRQFKFVDRTFNLNLATSRRILEFFSERLRPDLFLHFEMIPDRLPEQLRELIARFPAGSLQFEIGVQSLDPDVSERIKRRQNVQKLAENIRFLREKTGVHIHADLIAGLPGETEASFAAGFNELVLLGPQEIQVGILKRLRGTPIVRHDQAYQMVYSQHPPYEILSTSTMNFETLQRIRRFSRHWDLLANSGNFVETTPLFWVRGGKPYQGFSELSGFIHDSLGRQHGIPLSELAELIFKHLTETQKFSGEEVALHLWRDYQRGGRSDRPLFLRPFIKDAEPVRSPRSGLRASRQARHLATVPIA